MSRGLRVLLVVAGSALAAYLAFFSNARPAASLPPVMRKAQSLEQLLAMTPDQLAQVDIAEMNLHCAEGLPGAKGIDLDHALATLDRWAERVASETKRHLYRVTDPRYAEHYRHSEAYLRAEFLVQVLCEDLGPFNLSTRCTSGWLRKSVFGAMARCLKYRRSKMTPNLRHDRQEQENEFEPL
jgi:hypothetical protein